MGWFYHELIPVAVLLDNPGITKEEFVELLNQTQHTTCDLAETKTDLWDIGGTEYDEYIFHGGLHELGKILNLPQNPVYQSTMARRTDDNGLVILPPRLELIPVKKKGVWQTPRFRVTEHLRNELGELERSLIYEETILETGQKYVEGLDYPEEGYCTHVKIEKIHSVKDQSKDPTAYSDYELDISFRRIEEIFTILEFESLDSLIKRYPSLSPEFMFDFSVESGKFNGNGIYGTNEFRWINNNGLYSIDPRTFDLVCAPTDSEMADRGHVFDPLNLGYTDLIITAEAIKQNAGRLLSKYGKCYLGKFLERFPESLARHQRAVWDQHTSIWAKNKKLTHTEFMRARLLGEAYKS